MPFSGAQQACDLLIGVRSPLNGSIGVGLGTIPKLGAVNIGRVVARGIDFNLGYSMDAFGGALSANYVGSYTLKSTSQGSPLGLVVDCAGAYADPCGQPQPEYKHAAQFAYEKGPLSVNLRWRYVGGVALDSSFFGSVGGLFDIDSANYFDVETQYSLRDNLNLTLGGEEHYRKNAANSGFDFC